MNLTPREQNLLLRMLNLDLDAIGFGKGEQFTLRVIKRKLTNEMEEVTTGNQTPPR